MLADKIGRKPVFITGAVASSLVMFPYLGAIAEGNWVGIFAYGVLMHGALYSMAERRVARLLRGDVPRPACA